MKKIPMISEQIEKEENEIKKQNKRNMDTLESILEYYKEALDNALASNEKDDADMYGREVLVMEWAIGRLYDELEMGGEI